MDLPRTTDSAGAAPLRFAMRLSLAFGVMMFAGKVGAWYFTGSAAIFSDALESVVHVVAVAFAYFSLQLSLRPANRQFQYGYERISFFSAGFEGAMIMLAALAIIVAAVREWLNGIELDNLGWGAVVVAAAAAINAGLGLYLLRVGRKNRNLILEANGKHVLTDCYTSAGVLVGLGLVLITGWKPFDAICAIAVGAQILWSGASLTWRSVAGLMDYSDPEITSDLRRKLDGIVKETGVAYHRLRFRDAGRSLHVELHLLFPFGEAVGEAHRKATLIEERLAAALDVPADIVTHLEAVEDHRDVHRGEHEGGDAP